MSAHHRRTVTAVGLGLIAGATACSLVLGLRDGTTVGSGGDGGDDGGAIDDRNSPPPPDGPPTGFDGSAASCDGGLLPPIEDPDAVHVDPGTGADNLSCGGVSNPCKTLGKALTRVSVSPAKKIELAAGIYNESVTITNALGAITIEGGYDHSGSTWTGRCDETLVTVGNYDAGPPGTGTIHLATSAKVTFRLFTVDTTLQPSSFGGSAHALVMETLSEGTLENMDVLAQHGAPGANGVSLGTAPPNSICFSGSGNSGTTGGPGDAGAYTSGGYVPASGQQGSDGDFGTNKSGGPGTPFAACTVNCGSPMGYGACNPPITINGTTEAGSPGCGGSAGFGGSGGQGGGASVAVVMLGSSTLTLKGVRFATAGGGQGGSGGPGGSGGAGTPGSPGPGQTCFTGCNAAPFPSCGFPTGSSTINGGAGGPPGSDGGNGGTGGGGAGGPSHFIARSPAATVNGLTEIKPGSANGSGGAGGNGAAAGPSSTVTTF